MSTQHCANNADNVRITADAGLTCPTCGHASALIPLGARIDHPHHWRPWVVVVTQLALCERCGALAATEESSQPEIASWHSLAPAA